ncbi:MAG: hypothetical protein J4F38_01245 [Pseudomonadales bacterium]|nr:hypothetical protein [Pseudomonadales bacterium]
MPKFLVRLLDLFRRAVRMVRKLRGKSAVLRSASQCAQTILHCASHPEAEGGR